jgi:octaheme c-type cytochrome (tetrathionate reductase family)
MSHNDAPHRVTKPFFTFWTLTLLLFMGVGFAFGLTRMFLGLGAVTNLDDHNPWGIWIAFDVACGVALAAGGFTTAALVDIFGRRKYKPLLRPALLTAFLGYLWVGIALMFDLGRYWNIWRPMFNWQGNSVLFEVGMCVMAYLTVLSIEMSPSILEGLKQRIDDNERGAALLRKIEQPILTAYRLVKIVLPIFICAGVVLSFMHQSSLGTLMVIAPTKTSPLWNTALLPLLFLLSAIMVGFPMVILESIYANISFGRKAEMELLTPLAKIIPWFIGAYAVLKLGNLAVRWNQLDFLGDPTCTISLLVEIAVGVIAPFILLQNQAVRRSMGWLFFAVALVIFGVVLNRLNVFLVGYHPPFNAHSYFPSIGEIAMTVAIVSSILFCYRLLVTFFPILPGYVPMSKEQEMFWREERARTVPPFWTWTIRGAAIACLAAFIGFYVFVHEEAVQATVKTVEEVKRVKAAAARHEPPATAAYPQRPEAYKNYYLLNSDFLNARSDDYEPVPFAHRIHDELTGGDCGVCHHRYAMMEDDRVGEDLQALHAMFDTQLGGPCAACHDDMASNPPQACSRCHALPNESDDPARLGLKGAYHRQCIGCHERTIQPAPTPTACNACHHPWTPDHTPLVKLAGKPSPQAVTRACLDCHDRVGTDLLGTAHWNWKGQSPTLIGYEHRTDISKHLMVNNYCISITGTDPKACATCHIGYGWMNEGFDLADPTLIDCLVCHDTTGTYRKDPLKAGMPMADVDLVAVSRKVGRPSRAACGSCHFMSGGAPNAKHGDLEPALADPPASLDMHMGALQMRCQNCHATQRHRIAGMSMTSPAVEGRVRCENCHSPTPHAVAGMSGQHLDDHGRTIACETCHIPSFARSTPTLVRRDYSTAGQDRPKKLDALGMPTYSKRFGNLTWEKDLVPVYRWFDGTRHATLLGDRIDGTGLVPLNAPSGEKRNPRAKIFPFKAHTAVQPFDPQNRTLAIPSLAGHYWVDFDWNKAITAGMKGAGLEYSGSYSWAETVLYTGIHHGVVPAKAALGCADCHGTEAVNCVRCHRGAAGMDRPEHTRKVYPRVAQRIDFKALGYPDDPAMSGGRFFVQIGRGAPPQ